jgi:hypothetical protein
LVVLLIGLMTVSYERSGLPRQLIEMNEKSRCSILFHGPDFERCARQHPGSAPADAERRHALRFRRIHLGVTRSVNHVRRALAPRKGENLVVSSDFDLASVGQEVGSKSAPHAWLARRSW